ncbi:hypothetical protein KHQ81_00775 [Mycoplasmatota bacterium]|nr:hypothetical protein KHQ81_00775 [Mycoplasmatota bacterium]
MTKIKIVRKIEYVDKLRKYKVILDDSYIGDINSGEIKNFEVIPGRHTIYLKIDWCRSNKIDFYVSENEVIKFDCGSSIRGWRILINLIYITFLKNKYLWIKIKDKIS